MPTHDPAEALTRDGFAALVAASVSGAGTTGCGIGLELELFAVTHAHPTARLRLDEAVGRSPAVREVLAAAASDAAVVGASHTVEPGGQVEVATACHQRVPDAVDALDRAVGRLAARFHHADAALLAAGTDVWHPVSEVPQQLDLPRYRAMDRHFARHGPEGRRMMRHTAALQVNLDHGRGAERSARWQVANLVSPVATATFACSPAVVAGRPVRSRRALAWRSLDPTRTGFPAGIVAGTGDVEDHVLDLALHAEVLRIPAAGDDPRQPDGVVVPPGWRFVDWLTTAHPEVGRPTPEDARDHLTTLFPEVRARGFLELRAIDAVPARFRAAVVLLVAGAVLDARARDAILATLEPHRSGLPALGGRAATVGLADPRMCALAVEVWSYARDGASRLPGVDRRHLAAVDAFVDRFTVRGRCPADELAELLGVGTVAAMDWATEPLPTSAEVHR